MRTEILEPLLKGSCDWVHFEMIFTARADVGQLQFRFAESVGQMWIDDVLLEEL